MENCNQDPNQRIYCGKERYLKIVFARWKKLHLCCLTAALLSSFTAFFTFIVFQNKFNTKCPLYTKLRFSKVVRLEQKIMSYIVHFKDVPLVTEWGPDIACEFVLWVPILNMLMAVIWILIFYIKGEFSPSSQRKFAPSTFICGILVSVLSFAASIVITKGGSIFCQSFKSSDFEKCAAAQNAEWLNLPQMSGFYDYLMRSQMTCWITTHTWFLHTMMALIRWVTDADYVIAAERELCERPRDLDISALRKSASRLQQKRESNEDATGGKDSDSDSDK